jgi:hypothetical protein
MAHDMLPLLLSYGSDRRAEGSAKVISQNNILVVDDNPIVRKAFGALLNLLVETLTAR